MERDYVVALIGVGGTVLGFFLNVIYERIQKHYKTKDELQAAINRALLVTVVNKYPVVLAKLKDAIDANAHSLYRNKSVTEFYSKWLCDPTLALEREFINFMSGEQIEELQRDLAAIKL